jgi:integrase
MLPKIKFDPKKTQPLNPEQFTQLIDATDKYDTFVRERRPEERFGAELKAIFQIQRWTGLRILDVLVLPRKAIVCGVLKTKTLKTGALVEAELPKEARAALAAVKPRPQAHKDYFFWSRNCTKESLRTKWENRIQRLNDQLTFHTEEGEAMWFHSHMLRDTFAVELLLIGVSIEEVSRMLTHKNISTTQKHYDPWVKRRRDQLEVSRVAALKKMGATFSG